MKANQAGILSAILASTCCVGPLLLVAIGVGSGAVFIGRYHWFFIIGAMLALTWAWAKYLREKTICDCEHKSMGGRRSGMLALLISTVLVLGFASLNINSLRVRKRASCSTNTNAARERTESHCLFRRGLGLRDVRNSGAACAQTNRRRQIRARQRRDQNRNGRLRAGENASGTIDRGN